MTLRLWSPATTRREPWFRRHPILALTVAGALYAAILSLRLLAGGPEDAYSMLYVFPVALISIALGVRAGAIAGLIAVTLVVVWVVVRDVSLTPTGWGSRVLPILLLGLLLGHASDRLRLAETQKRQLEAAALLHRQAIEINDSLVQGMAAARWSLQAGRIEVGLRILDETIEQAHHLVSGLIRQAGMGVPTQDSHDPQSALSTLDHSL
jgi:hypothetical protein